MELSEIEVRTFVNFRRKAIVICAYLSRPIFVVFPITWATENADQRSHLRFLSG